MDTGCEGGRLLMSTGFSAALENGRSLAFYAHPGDKSRESGERHEEISRWQMCRILLPAALVRAALAGLAVSATQASDRPLASQRH